MQYLGLDRSVYSAWKNGKNKSYMKYLPQIADFFTVSTDWLTGKTHSNEKCIVIEISEREHQFLSTFCNLSEEGQDRVNAYITDIKDKYMKH